MPRVFIGICLVVGLFGVGGFLQGTQTTQTAALKQSRTLMPIAPASSDDRKTQVTDEHRRMTQTGDPKVVPNRDAVESDGTGERQTSGTEPSRVEKTYYCGAATKKGTACSRKVKGGGRCWQHKGQEALLAPDKLLISQ